MRVLTVGLTSLAFMLVGLGSPRTVVGQIDLTGEWLLTAADDNYPHFEYVTNLYITQAAPVGSRSALSGSFYWQGTNGDIAGEIWGWEDFEDGAAGKPCFFDSSTMKFHVEGYRLRGAGSTAPGWVLGMTRYDADVTPDGNHLINGVWPGGQPGVWEAVRVPEPSTLVLLAMGAVGLLAYAWRRRRS